MNLFKYSWDCWSISSCLIAFCSASVNVDPFKSLSLSLDIAFNALIEKIYTKFKNQFNIENINNNEKKKNENQSEQNKKISLNSENLKKKESSSSTKKFC